MAISSPERLRERFAGLLDGEQGVEELARGAARILYRAIDFDGFCLLTMDPTTIVPTGEVVENGLPQEVIEQMTAIEMSGEDYNAFAALGRAGGAGGLSAATGGDLARSRRHRELRGPHGFGDELRVALVADGMMWAGLTLLRAAERPPFSPAEIEALAALSPALAAAVRRSLLFELGPAAVTPREGAGLLLLAEDDSLTHADAGAEAWLAQLPSAGRPLPPVASAVAARARENADRPSGGAASARVRSVSGVWLTVRASLLRGEESARVAVVLEPARGEDLAPLLADLHGLSERERAVAQLVANGLPTAAIAERLYLSPWTVQDHLKSIFEKVGVANRGELVTRIFLPPAAGSALG